MARAATFAFLRGIQREPPLDFASGSKNVLLVRGSDQLVEQGGASRVVPSNGVVRHKPASAMISSRVRPGPVCRHARSTSCAENGPHASCFCGAVVAEAVGWK